MKLPLCTRPAAHAHANAVVMSFSSHAFVVKRYLDELYFDAAPFKDDARFIDDEERPEA